MILYPFPDFAKKITHIVSSNVPADKHAFVTFFVDVIYAFWGNFGQLRCSRGVYY